MLYIYLKKNQNSPCQLTYILKFKPGHSRDEGKEKNSNKAVEKRYPGVAEGNSRGRDLDVRWKAL